MSNLESMGSANEPPEQNISEPDQRLIAQQVGEMALRSEAADRQETHPDDEDLTTAFPELLEHASAKFAELVVPASPQRRPANLNRYRLTPLYTPDGKQLTAPEDTSVEVTYKEQLGEHLVYFGPHVYVDERRAIGLVYDNKLIAIAAATVTEQSTLLITQLQDVTGVRKRLDQEAYYRTGLHNGFLWRDTLVRIWEEIATEIGSPDVAIQSHLNSPWTAVRRDGKAAYDDVAARMQYEPPITKGENWTKRMT